MIDHDEYKEVLEALECGYLDTVDIEQYMQAICESLKKQIPKKLNHKTTRYVIQGLELYNDCIYCPLCNKSIDRRSDYCPDCGQALDWSDENE